MPYRAPETMTTAEQALLLEVTARHPYPRDHVLFSLALGTGLRLSELLGLNVGNVSADGTSVRTRVRLDPATTKGRKKGEVFLPDRVIEKLARFLEWKTMMSESVEADAPLFVSSWGRRLSSRRAQAAFQEWQVRAAFDRLYPFHCLRHSAITNVYRASRDLFLAQRFVRHASPLTTVIYTKPGDEETAERVRGLRC
jgi:site-specific recombinase XerC